MADITITGKTAERLQQLVQSRQRTVEEVLEDMLNSYQHEDTDMPPAGTLARMAWVAEHYPIAVEPDDVADRSRDILRDEYADYLLKRRSTLGE